MKKINGANVKKIQVPLPDIDTQATIERLTQSVRSACQATSERLERARRLNELFRNEALSSGRGT